MAKPYHYLFGPVASRRLGRSLGVDLTPYKTCCFNCIYCQLGPTTRKTVTRDAFVPVDTVCRELEAWHKSRDWANFITLSGSGEPTLHSGFGEIFEYIRSSIKTPAVLLSNGALFWNKAVREAARRADVVKLTLSAWNQASFEHINQPQASLTFDRLLGGIHQFRSEYAGQLWLEVFFVKGFNAAPDDAAKIAAITDRIRPDRIHFNTVFRPPANADALPVSEREMKAMMPLFHPKAEIISDDTGGGKVMSPASTRAILAVLGRRPCTIRQLSRTFNANTNEIVKIMAPLVRAGSIKTATVNGRIFFSPASHPAGLKPCKRSQGTASAALPGT